METIEDVVHKMRDESKWCNGNIGVRKASDADWEAMRDCFKNFADHIELVYANDPFSRYRETIVYALEDLRCGRRPGAGTIECMDSFLKELNDGDD